jgi:quercetin dioxygenase-like cupin family protein
MTLRGLRTSTVFAVAAVCALGLGLSLVAQTPPAVKRTVASKSDMLGCTEREGVMVWVEIPVGGAEGRHTHNAEVFAFVLEGTLKLENEGQPDQTLKAGDIFRYTPTGKWHQAVNTGTTPVKLAAFFSAEKGKPLTVPVK